MGGYTRQRKSSSSGLCLFNIFKGCCWHGSDDVSEDGFHGGRAWRSDEYGRRWNVAEPGIDGRASAFISRFFETRVSNPERQTFAP